MGWRIRIRENEADQERPFLAWDTVLKTTTLGDASFDWALADADETRNQGGLRAKAGLHTAVMIQLFSDRRVTGDMDVLDDRSAYKGGWWGDSVNTNEEPLGSHLWTLQRTALTQDLADRAADMVQEALQPIVDQGAVAYFDVRTSTSLHGSTGVLEIEVDGYSNDGRRAYSQKFSALWGSIADEAAAA